MRVPGSPNHHSPADRPSPFAEAAQSPPANQVLSPYARVPGPHNTPVGPRPLGVHPGASPDGGAQAPGGGLGPRRNALRRTEGFNEHTVIDLFATRFRAMPVDADGSHHGVPASSRPQWEFPVDLDSDATQHAKYFNEFQARLQHTNEFGDVGMREAMVARVDGLVAAMRASPALCEVCFNIAEDAIAHCGDRIALGLSEMEMAKISDDAQSGRLSPQALFATGTGMLHLEALDHAVNAKIVSLRAANPRLDEVEVRLAYHTELADALALPGVARTMIYRNLVDVSAAEIQATGAEIKARFSGQALAQEMARWKPWRQAMKRAHPQEYAALRKASEPERDRLAILPEGMTEGEYMQANDARQIAEKAATHDLTVALTQAFMSGAANAAAEAPVAATQTAG